MQASNDGMGAFYTHIENASVELGVGSKVAHGDVLGTVLSFAGIPPDLHLVLVEIIGSLPGGQYRGVDLYRFSLDLMATELGTVVPVSFMQDGSPPGTGNALGEGEAGVHIQRRKWLAYLPTAPWTSPPLMASQAACRRLRRPSLTAR